MKKLPRDYSFDAIEEKVNEIVEYLNLQEKKDNFFNGLDEWSDRNQPKKVEVNHEYNEEEIDNFIEKDFINFCYTNEENEVIKKCLKYCRHRQSGHFEITGIDRALSREDLKVFRDILEKI